MSYHYIITPVTTPQINQYSKMASFASFIDQFKNHERLLRNYKPKPEKKSAFLRKSANRIGTTISPTSSEKPKLNTRTMKAAALLSSTPILASKPLGQLPNIYSSSMKTKSHLESPLTHSRLLKPAPIVFAPNIKHTISSTELNKLEEEEKLNNEVNRESAISIIQMEEDTATPESNLEEPPKSMNLNLKRLIALQKIAEDIAVQQKRRSSIRVLPKTLSKTVEEKSPVAHPLTIMRNGVKYSIKNFKSGKLPVHIRLLRRGTIDFTHNPFQNSIQQIEEKRSRLESLNSITSLGAYSIRYEENPKPETPKLPEEPGSVPLISSPIYSVKADLRKWREMNTKINNYFDRISTASPEERVQQALRQDSEQRRLEKGRCIMKKLSLTAHEAFKQFTQISFSINT